MGAGVELRNCYSEFDVFLQRCFFYPRYFGLRVLSSPGFVCVCLSARVSTFACPPDNSSPKDENILLMVPIVFGLIELNPPGQIKLHFKIVSIYIAFTSLKYLRDLQTGSLPHPKWLRTYVFTCRSLTGGVCHLYLFVFRWWWWKRMAYGGLPCPCTVLLPDVDNIYLIWSD